MQHFKYNILRREKANTFSNLFRNAITEVVTGNPEIKLNPIKQPEETSLILGVIANYTYEMILIILDSSLKVSYKDQNRASQGY